MTDLNRYINVLTDDAQRYHRRHDKHTSTFNAFVVALPPYVNEPGLIVQTFEEALTTLARLRSQPFAPLFPPDVWQSISIIVATNIDVVSRDVAIRIVMLKGGVDLTRTHRSRSGFARLRQGAGPARRCALSRWCAAHRCLRARWPTGAG